jgi:formate hydrogenlyase transcriptional activator
LCIAGGSGFSFVFANWVQWYFVEPYKGKLEARRLEDVPKEETAAWWVYQNQEPVLVRVADRETRFSQMADRLAKLGLNSAYLLPLSAAHRKLGSLAFTGVPLLALGELRKSRAV